MTDEGPPRGSTLRGLRWSLRGRLAEHPRLYLPIARWKFPDAVLGPQTELVIEGFTRSAVTFATIAFQLAQPRPVRTAHTLHSVGHVVEAVRRGIPVLVTIREPEEVALSAVIREPYLTLGRVLNGYVRFYGSILPIRDQVVAGRFESVVADFGSVTRAINQRFGSAFAEFRHTDDDVRRCYEIIEDRSRRPPWEKELGRFQAGIITYEAYRAAAAASEQATGSAGRTVPERRVQRPSPEREALKDTLRSRLADPRLATLRARATAAYERFVSVSS